MYFCFQVTERLPIACSFYAPNAGNNIYYLNDQGPLTMWL